MPPGHEHAAQCLQALQVETEVSGVIDRGLLQIIEIGRIVDVTECNNLMKSDPKMGLERRDVRIRDRPRTEAHAAAPSRDNRAGTKSRDSVGSSVC
jgi:hypothetical protein